MPEQIKLSPRLRAAVNLSKKVELAWDVGTDHCFLPIGLISESVAERVIASDINPGPLLTAEENLKDFPSRDRITLLRCDGLEGADEYRPDEVFICGMGGELIRDIISDCPYLKNPAVRIIAQPMTKPEVLRDYLCREGFGIIEETLVREEKIYELLSAEYTGISRIPSPAESLCGRKKTGCSEELELSFLEAKAANVRKRKEGLEKSGRDSAFEGNLLEEVLKMIERIRAVE